MNLERIKTIPTSRDGKMAYGIFAALVARSALNEAIAQYGVNNDGALFGFMMAGVMLYTMGLAMVRFNTNRPLFESVAR